MAGYHHALIRILVRVDTGIEEMLDTVLHLTDRLAARQRCHGIRVREPALQMIENLLLRLRVRHIIAHLDALTGTERDLLEVVEWFNAEIRVILQDDLGRLLRTHERARKYTIEMNVLQCLRRDTRTGEAHII